jgi:phospholipid/cholesterol/gamma-HCH transport system permease protein
LALSSSSKRRDVNDFTGAPASWLARIGEWGLRTHQSVMQTIAFTGKWALSGIRVVQGQARFQRIDIIDVVQKCGWQTLPIVSLISFLVGSILAFMGAVQLSFFGAQLNVADLVAIGMAREMGAVMTGVIMAGRTGAATPDGQ